MLPIQLYTEFTQEELESLREQGVDLDDWDYAILVEDVSQFEDHEFEDDVYNEDTWKLERALVNEIRPNCYTLERLLVGCCDNTWYRVTWKGKPVVIGFAYHA